MRRCPSCGSKLKKGDTYCYFCGSPINGNKNNVIDNNDSVGFKTSENNGINNYPIYFNNLEHKEEIPIDEPKEVPLTNYVEPSKNSTNTNEVDLGKVIYIFMIIGTIIRGLLYIIPLAWCLPMTKSFKDKVDYGGKASIAFKICTFLFVSFVAGILMFVDTEH